MMRQKARDEFPPPPNRRHANWAKGLSGFTAGVATAWAIDDYSTAVVVIVLWAVAIDIHARHPQVDVYFGHRWYLRWCARRREAKKKRAGAR